jgi:hypothetical protein
MHGSSEVNIEEKNMSPLCWKRENDKDYSLNVDFGTGLHTKELEDSRKRWEKGGQDENVKTDFPPIIDAQTVTQVGEHKTKTSNLGIAGQ